MSLVFKSFALITMLTSAIASGIGLHSNFDFSSKRHNIVATQTRPVASNGFSDILFAVDAHLDPAPAPAPPSDEAPATAEADQPAPAAPVVVQPAAPVRTVTAPAPPPPAPAPAPPPAIVIGSGQQAYINQDRAAAGLAPLNWSSCLAAIAAGQAQAMANAGTIFHGNGVQSDWGCRLGSAQTGENVGEWGAGVNDAGINQLFMASAPHRANIMGPYHYVGTAWVVGKNGVGYIAVEFA